MPNRSLFTNRTTARSIFATSNGDFYHDNGDWNFRVDKWTANSTTRVNVLTVPESCAGLFIDIKENLYCSFANVHYVVRRSLMDPINTTTIVAGNGTAGPATDQLHIPRGLVVDFNLNLYVADCHNNRVLRFSPGQLNGTIVAGSNASDPIDLHCPVGIVLDADGYLFVTDFYNNRVVGSGPNGFRCLVGCSRVNGSAANQLSYPYGLSFDSYGNLFVADSRNNRLQKFVLTRNSCSKCQIIIDDEEHSNSLIFVRCILSSTDILCKSHLGLSWNNSDRKQ